ncbi:MAG: hypothetical protein K6B73_08750 [Treponema sp.]|nr:hypothetical protein [Treponema sp.]
MKLNKIAFLVLACAQIINISCSKKSADNAENLSLNQNLVSGTVLNSKAQLCLLGRDGQMHPVIKIKNGEQIELVEQDGKFLTTVIGQSQEVTEGAVENSTREIKTIEYTAVVYDNVDWWLRKGDCAADTQSAVIIEDSFIYSDEAMKKRVENLKKPLKFSTVVAKSNEDVPHNKYDSTKIYYYDEASKEVQSAFVNSGAISTLKDDIEVSRIAVQLMNTTRAVPRNALFAEAAKFNPSARVLAVLNAQKEEKLTYSYKEVLNSMSKRSYGVNVKELLTVDQSKDPFK